MGDLECELFDDCISCGQDIRPMELMREIEESYTTLDRIYSRFGGTLSQFRDKIRYYEQKVLFDNYQGHEVAYEQQNGETENGK